MHHALLVASLPVGERPGIGHLGLQQCLPEAGDVAVAEDAETALEELVLHTVALGVLARQEPHRRLPDRQPHRLTHHSRSFSLLP